MFLLVGVISFSIGGLVAGFLTYQLVSNKFRSKFQSQSAVIMAAGHQLRTPLNQILGMAQTLEIHAGKLPDKIQETINTIIGSGSNLKLALLDILDIMELESGQLILDPDVHSLVECIGVIERIHRPRAEKKGVTLDLSVDRSAHVRLNYDEVRFRQCTVSMVRQCVEQAEGGTVSIKVSTNSSSRKSGYRRIEVLVHDGGKGMDQSIADKYFKPIKRRLDSDAAIPEGARLSLMLARMLARRMGGDLTVKSAVGKGVTFFLKVPAKFEMPLDIASDDAPLPVIELARAAICEKTVMIVDDNEVNVQILNAYLRHARVANTLVARDGQEALDLVAAHSCDLILMDIQMPVMDGVTATRKIRASNQKWRDIPIIVVSAASQSSERSACRAAGATAFLSKPVEANDLYRKLARVLAA